jgi:hypothetical protein
MRCSNSTMLTSSLRRAPFSSMETIPITEANGADRRARRSGGARARPLHYHPQRPRRRHAHLGAEYESMQETLDILGDTEAVADISGSPGGLRRRRHLHRRAGTRRTGGTTACQPTRRSQPLRLRDPFGAPRENLRRQPATPATARRGHIQRYRTNCPTRGYRRNSEVPPGRGRLRLRAWSSSATTVTGPAP